ncbi:acyl-CoA dehydrogenase family protein [Thermodesulfobacteriota bacterium]
MDFDFSAKEKKLRENIRDLFDEKARAGLNELDKADIQSIRKIILQWLPKLAQVNYLDLGLDDGRNSPPLVAAQEMLAAMSPSLFLSTEVSTRVFGRMVAVYGTPDQQKEILPGLKEGKILGTVALSEEGGNIESNPLTTTGRPSNEGCQVTGTKGHVVNAPIADWIAVAGIISEKKNEHVVFFLIKKESEGLSIGARLPTLGYNGVATSSLSLDGCDVPANLVMGPFDGKEVLQTVRMWEDQVLVASSLGLIQRSFDSASNYAKKHESGGKPIIQYQEVGFKLAEMLTLLQSSQLLAYRAAWMGKTGDREEQDLVHCAKTFCAESAEEVTSKALQILGGQGYIRGNPVEEGFRDAKYVQIAGTSTEISRMKIGDSVLEKEC